jgi:ferrochelatase
MASPIVLVNLGTTRAPEPEAVREFLAEFLSDPEVVDYPGWLWKPILSRILRSRPEKVAEQYRSIWTAEGSPLESGTKRIAAALAARTGRDVRIAFRYGEPSLSRALAEERPLVVPLFPQRTGSTTGTIEKLVGSRAAVTLLPPDARGYIDAQADFWMKAVDGEPVDHVVVSFHGIPVRYDRAEKSGYRRDCEATYRALLERVGWPSSKATLSYQSRFGPEPWIGPATATVFEKLARSGARAIAAVTPGFVTEGLETIEEIGIRGKSTFLESGGERFVRIPCVEDHPSFVASLVEVTA